MDINDFQTAISSYTLAVKTYIQDRLGASLINETVTIPANASKDYSMVALLGTDHASYNKASASIEVKVLDGDVGSPTQGFYINAEGVITVGVNAAGVVRVHNYRNAPITCHVKVGVPRNL